MDVALSAAAILLAGVLLINNQILSAVLVGAASLVFFGAHLVRRTLP